MNENFKNIKGIIFDYGGTLDSEGRHWSYILREGLKEAGIETTLGKTHTCLPNAHLPKSV